MLSELKRRISDTGDETLSLLPVIFIIILGSFGYMLYASTHVYLTEQSVCREYYRIHEPTLVGRNGLMDEAVCKITQIQSRVAEILGVYKVLTYLPGLFLAGPYGKLARRVGKKPIMFMNLITYTSAGAYFTMICYFHEFFDVRFIYLTPLFDIFGGGYVIFSSFTYTYISESIDQKRLSEFLYKLSAGEMMVSFLALYFSSLLLRKHVYLQCLLGFISLSATVPFCCLLPSPKRQDKRSSRDSIYSPEYSQQSSETSSLLSTAPAIAPSLPMDIEDAPIFWTVVTTFQTKAKDSIFSCREMLGSSSLSRITLLTFFLLTCGANIRVVFVQWPSVTYGWILAEVQAIISYEAVISSILFLTLPTISHKILKPRLGGSVSKVDLLVTKFSAVAHVMGILCIGFAPTKASYILGVTVWRLGHGLLDGLRSYVTGLLDNKEDIEQLYLGIGMVETLGAMIATAAWSGLFAKVLGQGYLLSRLPFMASSVILMCCCACIWVLGKFGSRKSKGTGYL